MSESKEATVDESDNKMAEMQQEMERMAYKISELSQASRNKSAMIIRLSSELETLKKRMDKLEGVAADDEDAEMDDAEMKAASDKIPYPDLTFNADPEPEHKEDANGSPSSAPSKPIRHRGFLLLWSGSTGYSEHGHRYNNIQLMNLAKFRESKGTQKPYRFELNTMKPQLFGKKKVHNTSSFDRHWFAHDAVTNTPTMPHYLQHHIDRLNAGGALQNNYLQKLNTFSKRLSLKTLSLTENANESGPHKKPLLDASTNHSILFRCGGVCASNKQRSIECDATLFNHLHDGRCIKGYTLRLPPLPRATSLAACCFDESAGELLCVGGDTDTRSVSRAIFSLDMSLSQEAEAAPEWRRAGVSLLTPRKSASVCRLDARHVAVMGGKTRSGEKTDSVELLLERDGRRCIKLLAPLTLARSAAGALAMPLSARRVLVGGGWGGWHCDATKRTVECFDVCKNRWMCYAAETQHEHQFSPALWADTANPSDVVFIAGDCVGIDSKSMLGTVEWTDLREGVWHTFADADAMRMMFELRGVDEKAWRSRALMVV